MSAMPESTEDFRHISNLVLSLPPEHRFELAQKLWDSLGEDIPIVESPALLALLR